MSVESVIAANNKVREHAFSMARQYLRSTPEELRQMGLGKLTVEQAVSKVISDALVQIEKNIRAFEKANP